MNYGSFSGWGAAPRIGYQQTRADVNNQRALGAQQAAQRTSAGAGLSRGRGQRALDANRGAVMRANADAGAAQAMNDDQLFNAGMASQYRYGAANEKLQYDSLDEQLRQSQWDSRFGNMTNAWNVLAGLLR